MEHTPSGLTMSQAHEIAFVDSTVSELDSLLTGLRPEVEAVVLSASTAATTQIAALLQERSHLKTIHIITHGRAGELSFSAGALSLETVKEHAKELRSIGQALGVDGRLLLWSCHTGEGKRGEAFVDALARMTGVEVDAATGLIGAAAHGGNWVLAIGSGGRKAVAPLTARGVAAYPGVMDTITATVNSSSGDSNSLASLMVSPSCGTNTRARESLVRIVIQNEAHMVALYAGSTIHLPG
jgi:hypothetical protein